MTTWTAMERRWRDELFAAMIPAGERGLPGLGELDLRAFWQVVTTQAPPLVSLGLRLAVWFVTWAPLFYFVAPRSFVGLSARGRGAMLERLAGSRWYLVRQLLTTIKAMACLAYLGDPRVRALVGGTASDQ